MKQYKAILPLKYYDNEGRIKPSWPVFVSLLVLMRAFLVFIASISYRPDTGLLLSLFYPDRHYFYASMLVGLPALLVMSAVLWRHWLREHWRGGFLLLKPLVMLALLADLLLHVHMANHGHWAFSWLLAVTILADMLMLMYWLRSRTLRMMLQDWQKI
ncbi:DUF2919 family protein [Bowmanella yangjiangensis]|uniref:DUF2919 family protein n=1 Tax=Bowmanella yangjiangensis TaxID=2811230 RepID=A0ABS3CUG3_9ALTE|nr:DUF2919 family protein [Bowmanella yangjiangensis]MBN7820715.1 DUF2919 family protein [Bowmanella yangjiangensis]